MYYKEFETLTETQPHITEVWVCDFRYEDFANKPIRHIEPTLVKVVDNAELPQGKNVYYANFHFKPIGKNGLVTSKVIAPYDNTGYRSRTGGSISIFLTKEECLNEYVRLCNIAKEGLIQYKNEVLAFIDARINEVDKRIGLNEASLKNVRLSQSK
jgi:hypothetical protein